MYLKSLFAQIHPFDIVAMNYELIHSKAQQFCAFLILGQEFFLEKKLTQRSEDFREAIKKLKLAEETANHKLQDPADKCFF